IDLLTLIREESPDAGVLMMSAERSPEIVFHALFEGASDFLEKPLIPPEVDLRLRSIIKKQKFRNAMRNTTAELEREKRLLLKYFSPETAQALLSGKQDADLRGASVEVSIMFFSIKHAGRLLRSASSQRFADFLNIVLVDVMDIVAQNKGSVNKLNGAGLLATFGLPFPGSDDAAQAIQCARSIQDHFRGLNQARMFSFGTLETGVGIASGPVFAGNIGNYRRMEYTVIGDTANLAARLEALAGTQRGEILTDQHTIERSKTSNARLLPETRIRGRAGDVAIYNVM
ncbi:MAG: hypothetical protein K8S54_11260, partial [Spirochaetia bacterium]|nr:hypothetical protein [Spirochaetia bacterium]